MFSRPAAGSDPEAHYFTYGTLQAGFPNHRILADILGRAVGRFRTVDRYPLVVPVRPACPNPACRHEHRVPALLPDRGIGFRVEGEVYAVGPAGLARLDSMENYCPEDESRSTYVRRVVPVEPVGGGPGLACHVYFIADPGPYRDLLRRSAGEAVSRYTRVMAKGRLKPCCRRRPGHPGKHDVSHPVSPR